MLKKEHIISLVLWIWLVLMVFAKPLVSRYFQADVQGAVNLNVQVDVAAPSNFDANWSTSGASCLIQSTWDVSNHCNPVTSGTGCYVDDYTLTWELSAGWPQHSVNVIPGSSINYTIFPLDCSDANYDLSIWANYNSYQSRIITAITQNPPANPTNLHCTNIGTDHLTLNWTPSASGSLASQNIYQNSVLTVSTGATITNWDFTGLTSGTSYTFKVSSLNAGGDESSGTSVNCSTTSGGGDTTPPTGSIVINSDAEYTNLNLVELTLNTNDATQMRFSNNNSDWSLYEAYANTKSNWDLNDVTYGGDSSQGLKTVYVQLKDSVGNTTTATISDSIIYDNLSPTSSASPTGWTFGTNQTVTLSSEVGATIKYATAVTGSCSSGGIVFSNYSAPFSIQDWVNEGRVCFYAIDEAGNTESSINAEIYIIDTDAPESHVLPMNTYTNTQTFQVNYTTSNDSDLDYVELYYSYENGVYQKYTDAWNTNGHYLMSPIDVTFTSDGNYKFYTRATDLIGNTEEVPTTLPDAETNLDTVAPAGLVMHLNPPDFHCYAWFNPHCHTLSYDATIEFDANADFAEMYISGDVSNNPSSTYAGNVNQWIPFSTSVIIPIDSTVDAPRLSKDKTITVKVRDNAENESSDSSETFRFWKIAPEVYDTDLSIQNCTMYNNICYRDNITQTMDINVGLSLDNEFYDMMISTDVTGVNTNTWIAYANQEIFDVTSGTATKNIDFKVRWPAENESNSIRKVVRLRTEAPSVDFQINPSACKDGSTPSLCKVYSNIVPLIVTAETDTSDVFITGNVDASHSVYGSNVENWITTETNITLAVTSGLGVRNIYLKGRDVLGHESSEILRQIEVVEEPANGGGGGGTAGETDTDGDGMPDTWEIENSLDPNDPYDADFDPDEDNLTNLEEYQFNSNPHNPDTDNDGLQDGSEIGTCPNILDSDSDNDTLLDGAEIDLGTDPCNSDSDGDGLSDGVDPNPLDPDNSNVVDTDADGIPDDWEDEHWLDKNDPSDAFEDRDTDGLINREEYENSTDIDNPDSDFDGLKDGVEVHTHFTDPLNEDTDGDGYLDGLEVENGTDPLDPNDPGTNNENDEDGNGLDDDWESQYYTDLPHSQDWYKNHDSDHDKLTDYQEYVYGTNPFDKDTDDDKLNDYKEVKKYFTDPTKADSDGDGLDDKKEVTKYKTNPNKKDTDGDKFTDGSEIDYGTDPLDPNSYPQDADLDGMPDAWEEENGFNPYDESDATQDPDHDGLSNRAEYEWSTNPHNPDTDGDGLLDGREVQIGTDPLDPDSKFTDENKNGVDDEWEMLYFGELVDDIGRRDYDHDGLSDKLEYDYKTNPLKPDTDGDGLTDAEEIFMYGTDPLDPNSNKKFFAITNVKDNSYIATGDPLIKGVAPADSIVEIVFENEKKEEVVSILTQTDPSGIFVGRSSVKGSSKEIKKLKENDFKYLLEHQITNTEIPDGKYYVYANLFDNNAKKRSKTKAIFIEIDASLNLASPNPELLSNATLTIENFFQGVEVIIHDRTPEVRGTTYFGSQVIATWRSLVLTSSLIADSGAGEFSIFSPKPLAFGKHTVTLYAITPEGIRSPDLTIPFEIKAEQLHGVSNNISYWKYYLLVWIFLLILLFILWIRRTKEKNYCLLKDKEKWLAKNKK